MGQSELPVFISYARKTNAKHAEALAEELRDVGAFLDTSNIEHGNRFPEVLATWLLASRVVVVLADETYFERWYCLRELNIALAPFRAVLQQNGSAIEQGDALRHIVVALPSDGCPYGLKRLPPHLREKNWPLADQTQVLAAFVRRRLTENPETLEHRLASQGVTHEARARLVEESALPSPWPLVGMPTYPDQIPPSLGHEFAGRANELWHLHFLLSTMRGEPGRTASLTGAILGGGGFGKTRLALEYVHRFGPETYPGGLFWLDASSSPARLEEQHYGILQSLRPEVAGLEVLREMKRTQHRDVIRDELLKALNAAPPDQPILFVLDNVPETPEGRRVKSLDTWCPALGKVTVVVTSRTNVALVGGIESVRIDTLDEESAVKVLTQSTNQRAALKEDDWRKIVNWVGCLPLALELLNRSLRVSVVTPKELLELVSSRSVTRELDAQSRALQGLVPAGALRGITEALDVSYQRLSEAAQEVVRTLAEFSPAPLPTELVDAVCSPEKKATVRSDLIHRSFLTPARGIESSWQLHRALADFLRTKSRDESNPFKRALNALLGVVTTDTVRNPAHRPRVRACLPHVRRIIQTFLSSHETAIREDAERLSTRVFSLADCLRDFGDRTGENEALEEAVTAYRAALEVFTREAVPLNWATVQNNLGIVLEVLGEREEGTARLEEAVTAYHAALEVRTREAVPLDWAATQNNLGVVLWELGRREEGTARLEEAVTVYRAALEVYTREALPLDWSSTQDHLGIVLRVLGEREEGTARLEEAVTACRAALEVRTREAVPLGWAAMQSNLGSVLQVLGQREKGTARLEEAVTVYRAALEVQTREAVPLDWATVQNNLGIVFHVLGEREEGTARLEEAVTAYRAALEVRTREAVPLDWAATQNNLGSVLQVLGRREEGTARLEEAVTVCRAALEVRTREAVPLDWAATQNNLGIVLRVLGEREQGTARLEEAVTAYRAALEVYTPERTPHYWNLCQKNLRRAQFALLERRTGSSR